MTDNIWYSKCYKYQPITSRIIFLSNITSNFIIEPIYDGNLEANWQATSNDLQSSAVQSHVDRNSFSTQHYVFLTGQDSVGAIGIAYVGTPCFTQSNGVFIY